MEFFAEVVQHFGVPKSVGQIYGLLYASPVPLSFSDIVERLEMSKGSASQGLQLLRSLGAINVADAKSQAQSMRSEIPSVRKQSTGVSPMALGSLPFSHSASLSVADAPRREYFEPELSLRKLMSGVLQKQLAPLATTSATRLTRLRELAEQVTEGNDFYLDQAKQLNIWRKRLKTVLPVLSALLGSRSSN